MLHNTTLRRLKKLVAVAAAGGFSFFGFSLAFSSDVVERAPPSAAVVEAEAETRALVEDRTAAHLLKFRR